MIPRPDSAEERKLALREVRELLTEAEGPGIGDG